MSLIIRIIIAIVAGVLITGLLDYFGLLTHQLNVLIGVLVALLVFWQYDGAFPGRHV